MNKQANASLLHLSCLSITSSFMVGLGAAVYCAAWFAWASVVT